MHVQVCSSSSVGHKSSKHHGWITTANELGSLDSSRAVTRDVPFLTALVASTFLGLGAIPADVTDAIAVVALGALNTVARHVAYASTSVASPCRVSSTSKRAVALGRTATLGAVACHMAALSTAVASASRSRGGLLRAGAGAVAGDVTGLVTLVAGLGLGLASAVTGDMAFFTAVVAGRSSGFGAVCRLVTESTAVEASTSTRHIVISSWLVAKADFVVSVPVIRA